MPIKLPFGWWLCRDTTAPKDYPPKCRQMLTDYRLAWNNLYVAFKTAELQTYRHG